MLVLLAVATKKPTASAGAVVITEKASTGLVLGVAEQRSASVLVVAAEQAPAALGRVVVAEQSTASVVGGTATE